ncbi:MAG: hypothetical protein GXP48_00280 [Acidobacteria bacterium]|nr:hypothetical protein [Acidobacteriota bacterium]
MSGIEWPDEAAVAGLPENHRRAVAAVLHHLERRLTGLLLEGTASVPTAELARLRELGDAAQETSQKANIRSLLAALQVLADDIEPQRLTGYGSLDDRQKRTLRELAAAMRRLLEQVEPAE